MATVYRQSGLENVISLTNKEKNTFHHESINMHKYSLKCNSCLWNVSYCETSGHLDITQKSVICPVCKDGKINSSKFAQYR